MRWDSFFDDLEDQLDSEWEAERAALDSEAERLRLSRLRLRERLRPLVVAGTEAFVLELLDGSSLRGHAARVGADWLAFDEDRTLSTQPVPTQTLVPLQAISAIVLTEPELLRTARAEGPDGRGSLDERMTLGFILRDLARRRLGVTVHVCDGRQLSGTIDRALNDHLDLALHDAGAPRRSTQVRGWRILPFSAVCSIRFDTPSARLR